MATCLDFAKVAFAVYFDGPNQYFEDPPGHMVDDWTVQRWQVGGFFDTGFQGGIFTKGNDIIVGFCGTNPKKKGKLLSDLSADLRIGARILPNQCTPAKNMVKAAQQIAGRRRVYVTGHSLGGGLAQVAGVWCGVPFVTFNAPAMRHVLIASKYNVFKPQMMMRSRRAQPIDDSEGVNFRIAGDLVSIHGLAGGHVGMVVDLRNATGGGAHGKGNCWQAVLETEWANVNPFGD